MSHDRGRSVFSRPNPLAHLGPLARNSWAAPTTAIGLVLVALAWAGRGRLRRVAGTLEAHGGWLRPLFAGAVPILGRIEAVALGHVIVGRSAAALDQCRDHERVHVRQCERWGPLFLPAYALAGVAAWWRGADPYLGNRFEREARASEQRAAGPPRPDGFAGRP